MTIKEVAATLEQFAPLPLQESYDNAGLQIGLTENENVSGVLLCLDVTEKIILEAEKKGCNLIVAHHPLLFRPLKRISGQTQVERCVILALQKGISIYAAHTNLDNAQGGVNFMMAEKIGLTHISFLESLKNGDGGSGIVGYLSEPEDSASFLQRVAETFGVESMLHNELLKRPINCVALCGGAGEFLLDRAIEVGADAFLTGEMGYHRYFGHEGEIQIGVMGHYQSEQYTIDLLHGILSQAYPSLHIEKTELNTNPIYYNGCQG